VAPQDDTEGILTGLVVRGDGRGGAELGFPTANVELDEEAPPLPEDGVYVGWLEDETGTRRPAAVSVGSRPTYYGDNGVRLLEAHVLDFSGDLYGQKVSVGLTQLLRGQLAFRDSEELVAQMHKDVEAVRAVASS
jgi:FAD synthase